MIREEEEEDFVPETLGGLVREWRTARRMTVRGLAAAAGISPAAISKWETGAALPRMPELDAVLAALDCPEAARREAYARVNAPRALNRIKELSPPPGRHPMAPLIPPALTSRAVWFPSSGDLLRCLRLRQGLSLEDVAAGLGVRTSSVSRWENGEMLLPERHRDACAALLATTSEERRALQNVFLSLPEEPNRQATSRDALDQRAEELRLDVVSGTSELMDLRFLSLEALLFRQPETAWRRQLVIKTLTWHAQWLYWQERYKEAGPIAERALLQMPRENRPDPRWFRAVQIHAAHRAGVAGEERFARPERAMRMVRAWLDQTRWPHVEAWAYNILADYHVALGDLESAVRLVPKANAAAERSGNRATLRNSHYDGAFVLVRAGRADEARALLDTGFQPNVYHRVFEAIVWARVTTAQNDLEGATGARQQIRHLIQAYRFPMHHAERLQRDFNLSDLTPPQCDTSLPQ